MAITDQQFAELQHRVERLEVLVRQQQGQGSAVKSVVNQLQGIIGVPPATSLRTRIDALDARVTTLEGG